MEMKILICGAVVLGGFLWCYLFLRQIVFNFSVAYPLIRKMNSLQDGLISPKAKTFTLISNLICLVLGGGILFAVIYFTPLYVCISFAGGALAALIFILVQTKPANKSMFDSFCRTYYQFIPHDELRTIVYNKDYGKIKPLLKKMEISGTFVPDFK